jgi:nitrile hydratase
VNGVHDMGGTENLGPIAVEANEPVFHAQWERRAFAITMACGMLGEWNLDMSRFARERTPGPEYLASTYYEIWLGGLQRLLVERGLVPPEEIRARVADADAAVARTSHPRVPGPAEVDRLLRLGSTARRSEGAPARFAPGQAVRARLATPRGHTRLPRYVRGREGVIDRDHGVFVFADAHAMGLGAQPQHLYSVRFAARALWGPEAGARDAVYVDLWDDHLEAA